MSKHKVTTGNNEVEKADSRDNRSPNLNHASYGNHDDPRHEMYGVEENPGARDGSANNEPLRHVIVPPKSEATDETDAAILEVIAAGRQAEYDAGIPAGSPIPINRDHLNSDHVPL